MKYSLTPLLIIILCLPSCGYERDFDAEITSRNFVVTMDENPENDFLIGTLEASSSYGKLEFDLLPITPPGAFSFDSKTCDITVANAALFDFETYPVITSRIALSNKDNVDTAFITINLADVTE